MWEQLMWMIPLYCFVDHYWGECRSMSNSPATVLRLFSDLFLWFAKFAVTYLHKADVLAHDAVFLSLVPVGLPGQRADRLPFSFDDSDTGIGGGMQRCPICPSFSSIWVLALTASFPSAGCLLTLSYCKMLRLLVLCGQKTPSRFYLGKTF